MKKFYFVMLAYLLATAQTWAAKVTGLLVNEQEAPVSGQLVYLTNGAIATTFADGNFTFTNILKGTYELKAEIGGQLVSVQFFTVDDEQKDVDLGKIVLRKNIQLKEAEVRDYSIRAAVERLPEVKDNIIYAGKKNEVVKLSTSTANLAQNSSRQIFARVPGIQVWESDGSGVQMGIASRGLSPNRMWEFNTRQNGYDIAADPFGYPEAYYTPSVESLERIEVIRGAASLQYGPQFGGVVNYIKKRSVSGKKIGVESMQTVGSNGMFSTFNAVGGNIGKWTYYANVNYRRSDGWRKNNGYNTWNGFMNIGYQVTRKLHISAEYTRMDQLVQQPGGLTDSMFKADAQQSQRNRNWFKLIWNIASLQADYQLNANNRLNVKAFWLNSDRNSIGFLSAINTPDARDAQGNYGLRTIDKDHYNNYGVELRHLFTYKIANQSQALSVGARYYEGATDRIQNKFGNRGTNYSLDAEQTTLARDLTFNTTNMALFAEHLFNITKRWSISPGVRAEWLNNKAEGILDAKNVDRSSKRNFVLLGVSTQYKVTSNTNVYANIVQGYRPVLFSDISVATTDSINPDLKDASGYNADFGYRGNFGRYVTFDVSAFYLSYGNRVGTYTVNGKNYRTNIGASVSKGIESYVEVSPTAFFNSFKGGQVNVFASMAFTHATYTSWDDPDQTKNVKGKQVENAPQYIHRFGLTYRYKVFSTTFQYSMVGEAYADALNTKTPNASATAGLIPSYEVADWSFSVQVKKLVNVNGGVNNLANTKYFTRRAGGYPGPGLLPADGRIWYLGLGVKF